MKRIHLAVISLVVSACSTGTAEQVEQPAPQPEQPIQTEAPPAEPEEPAEPAEPPAEAQKEPVSDKVPYPGKTVVALKVERQAVLCSGKDPSLSFPENRRACMDELAGQVKETPAIILITNETRGRDCPTCVSMTAEASLAIGLGQTQMLFMDETAGEVNCQAGATKQTLEQSRTECYETLAKQGSSIGADVVFPLAIEEGGSGCKGCVSIVGTGYTAKVLR